MFCVVGLGNPGSQYEHTRHNTGRIVLGVFEEFLKGKFGKEKIRIIAPDTFMNRSGEALRGLIKNKKDAEHLVVIHDDLDIPFGSYKISFNKSSGGHKGVESIIKAVKTEAFTRVRVGISPATKSGKIKKPKGEEAVGKLILGRFTPSQTLVIKKLARKISDALACFIIEGREKAMSKFN